MTYKQIFLWALLLLTFISRGFCATPQEQLQSARDFVKQNENDKALKILESLVSSGFANVNVLKNDADLQKLQGDARFQKVMDTAQRNLTPCKFAPEYRQFDFWVGEWDVIVNGGKAGTNSIQKILEDCVIFENWTGGGGYSGKSFNLYDPITKRWQQTWVDSTGSLIEFHGQYVNNEMRYTSETLQADGSKVLGRMTYFKLPEGKLRQLWEQSTDGGKTWTVAFDGIYEKRK